MKLVPSLPKDPEQAGPTHPPRLILRRIGFLLAMAAFCPLLAGAEEEAAPETRRIREVRIDIGDVYSEERAEESAWARQVNRLHINTREHVIRNKLLFKEGDVLDQDLLDRTERSLRRLRFLNRSEIRVIPVDAETVDVEVETQDAWSFAPGVNLDSGGGLTTVKAHVMELNLLGYGKKTYGEAIWESDVGTTWKVGYQDYQVLGSQWVGGVNFKTGPLIKAFGANATLPLYSPDSKWSYGGTVYWADQIIRRFEDGEESDRFAKDQILATSFVKRAFGKRFRKKTLSFKLKYKKADYSTLGAQTTIPPPPDQENLTPIIGLSTERVGWAKSNYINKMGSTEDFWVGLRGGVSGGYGIPLGDGFELGKVSTYAAANLTRSKRQLLSLNTTVSSEVVRNTIFVASGRFYQKFSHHTLAARIQTKFGWDLDSSKQFQLGGESGLRGYDARRFTGDKVLLVNLEDRQFWGKINWGPEIAIGSVLFVDTGDAWGELGEEIDMNWSAGFGLRLAMTRMPHQPILRLDFGWAIPEGGFALTVGHEQHF